MHFACASFTFLLLASLLGNPTSVVAGYELVWSLGAVNGNPNEFGEEIWGTNAPSGSSSARDDDFYFAGQYPAPIGTVATDEPTSHLEGTLSTGSPISRLHFPLSPAQASPTARVRLVAHLIWGGVSTSKEFGQHQMEVRLNGALLGTQTVSYAAPLVIEAAAPSVVAGANVLQIRRINPAEPYGWISFDALSFEIHATGMADSDGDGLPRWWEEEHGFDDADPSDAARDTDNDGLTNLQEFLAGTHPRLADTDGDGLLDGQETTTNPLLADTDGDGLSDGFELAQSPPLNPNAIDTDGDGVPDGWEIATGYAAANAAITPPAFPYAIGINFVTELHPTNTLSALQVAGYVPQMNWNHTRPLTSWNDATGSQTEIVAPSPGQVLNSAGAPTGMTFSWTAAQSAWAMATAPASTPDCSTASFKPATPPRPSPSS